MYCLQFSLQSALRLHCDNEGLFFCLFFLPSPRWLQRLSLQTI
jgi:hypothetical protein